MEDITVEELKEKLDNKEDFVFLDVREEWEYEEDNLGALNISLGQLPHQSRRNQFANLIENGELTFGRFFVFHTSPIPPTESGADHLFQSQPPDVPTLQLQMTGFLWDACGFN